QGDKNQISELFLIVLVKKRCLISACLSEKSLPGALKNCKAGPDNEGPNTVLNVNSVPNYKEKYFFW
ncbi:TPA: hypothetical protein ACM7CW_004645, partial [Escherichia coli]